MCTCVYFSLAKCVHTGENYVHLFLEEHFTSNNYSCAIGSVHALTEGFIFGVSLSYRKSHTTSEQETSLRL